MPLIDDVLVDLVHDSIDIILLAEVRDECQLLLSEDLSAGVGGVADQDGLDAGLPHGILQHLEVKVELGRDERHIDRLAVGHDGLGMVVLEIR